MVDATVGTVEPVDFEPVVSVGAWCVLVRTSSSLMFGPMGHSSMHSCCSMISTPVPRVG